VPTPVKNDIECKSLFLKSPVLVLASTSAYRRELLSRLKIPFECAAPGVDETRLPDEAAHDLVVRLAAAKAAAVAARHPEAWVIGSDQVAVLSDDGKRERIFGKPGSASQCREQLSLCSGRTLAFLTAVAVMHQAKLREEFVDTTRVTFRTLDSSEIERYVMRESPLDCAGGFKSEGLGIALCESIESTDPTALIGLPLIRLAAALRGAGFPLP
jgi:septum formation protein